MQDEKVSKMNPVWKAFWIDALEGGLYKQGQGYLKRERPNGEFNYCCLGVLAEIMAVPVVVAKYANSEGGSVALPDDAQIKAELDEEAITRLVNMNDGWDPTGHENTLPSPFPAIAHWIKENL